MYLYIKILICNFILSSDSTACFKTYQLFWLPSTLVSNNKYKLI